MKAENGPFVAKMAPYLDPSPWPLKTPEMEMAKGGQAIGGNPGNLRGSISLPLAGPHASDAPKVSYGRQKSQKPFVVGISVGFLTVLMLLMGPWGSGRLTSALQRRRSNALYRSGSNPQLVRRPPVGRTTHP